MSEPVGANRSQDRPASALEVGDPPPPSPPQSGANVLKTALDAVDEAYARNVKHFSEIGMGSRLTTIGLGLLLLDIGVRVVPSISAIPIGIKPIDDLAFISVLVVSGLMMAGGILANLYLVWNVQRSSSEIARMAQASIERETTLAGLSQQSEPHGQ